MTKEMTLDYKSPAPEPKASTMARWVAAVLGLFSVINLLVSAYVTSTRGLLWVRLAAAVVFLICLLFTYECVHVAVTGRNWKRPHRLL